jgi:L-malate glycosyltransferase
VLIFCFRGRNGGDFSYIVSRFASTLEPNQERRIVMNIGIACYPTYGGSGVVATELGKALAERGHIVHFITYDRPVRLDFFTRNIFYHQVSPPEYPLFDFVPYESALTSKLVEVALYHNLDLLHVHYAIPHASSAFLAREILESHGRKLPFITTLHGTDITLVGKEEAYKPIVEFSLNKSDGITAVSEYLQQSTLENFQITREVRVIPNFLDIDRFRRMNVRDVRNRLAGRDEKIIMHASNFRKVKRMDDVLDVFLKIHEAMPSRMLLLGDGPERSALEKRVRDLNMTADVIFLGNQDRIEDILPLGDLFLIPSEVETFGLAALEAMASGLPVVGTNTGGMPEVVQDGLSGHLLPLGDVDGMAEACIRILGDSETYRHYANNANQRAQDFSIENVVPLYEAYYNEVLGLAVAQPAHV